LAAVVALLGAVAGPGAARTAQDERCLLRPLAPSVSAASWEGDGEVAYVSRGQLYLLDGHGHPYRLAGPGQVSKPAWSADGDWVAYLRSPAPPAGNPYAAEPSTLWVARSDGADAHPLRSSDVTQFAWGPAEAGENVAFSATNPQTGSSKVFLAGPLSTHPRLMGELTDVVSLAWAPSGHLLAISYDLYGTNGFVGGKLEITPTNGASPPTIINSAASMELASWWPDGKGVIYWADPDSSQSLAADGVPLVSLDVADGRSVTLATTLVHANWLSWSPNGTTLAIVAGGNRSVWGSGKHVELCSTVTGRCKPAPLPPGHEMSMEPTWTTAGTLVYVVAPGTRADVTGPPPGSPSPRASPYGTSDVSWWYGAQEIWAAGPSGAGAHPLTAAGTGAHTPTATTKGLLYIRGDGLWYLASGAGTTSRIAAELGPQDLYGQSYYGYVGWSEDYSWHA
jgi:TolB protein